MSAINNVGSGHFYNQFYDQQTIRTSYSHTYYPHRLFINYTYAAEMN
jgi:hypothetical protein